MTAPKDPFRTSQDLRTYHPDITASAILDKNCIPNCIVGEMADRVYGRKRGDAASAGEMTRLHIVVDDDNLDKAHSVLTSNSFSDLTDNPNVVPSGDDNWRCFSQSPEWKVVDGALVVQPASAWCLSGCLEDFDSDTILYDNPAARFPRVEVYVHALIDILCKRSKMPLGGQGDQVFSLAGIIEEQYPRLREKLSPADQFFIEYYWKGPTQMTIVVVAMREEIGVGGTDTREARLMIEEDYKGRLHLNKPVVDVLRCLGYKEIIGEE